MPKAPFFSFWLKVRVFFLSLNLIAFIISIHAFNNSGRHLEFLIYDVSRGKISAAIIEL